MKAEEYSEVSVAIQGGFGAFHEIAAKEFFNGNNLKIVPCDTFTDLFDELKEKYSGLERETENRISSMLEKINKGFEENTSFNLV